MTPDRLDDDLRDWPVGQPPRITADAAPAPSLNDDPPAGWEPPNGFSPWNQIVRHT